jgi:hypothetical protein
MALPRPAQLVAVQAYVARTELIRRVLGATAVAAYEAMDPFDQADVDAFADRMVATSLAGQQAMVATLAAYVSAVSDEDEDDFDLDELEDDATGDDTVPDEGLERTWHIPFYKFWGDLGDGVDVDDAREGLVSGLGRTAQSLLSFSQAKAITAMAVPYQRVRAGEDCEFCNEAPDEVYEEEPMPLHVGCRCSVMPVAKGG